MRLDSETYAVVSYEEMMESRQRADNFTKEANKKYENFLITCLCEVGFANKTVREKRTGNLGVLEVVNKGYLYGIFPRPCEIKFYPITKRGIPSVKSQYVSGFSSYREDIMVQQLLNCFELVGDENES